MEVPPAPPPIHWLVRLLALLLALLGVGIIAFATWALIFDRKEIALELLGMIPFGLLVAGPCGRIAVLGRVGPRVDMDLDAPVAKVPTGARIWAGAICLLSPMLAWLLVVINKNPHGWFQWLNAAIAAYFFVYIVVSLARMCLSGNWPGSVLRFARRANMTWREQMSETRREHAHRRNF